MCDGQELSHSTRKIVIGTIAGGSFLFTVAMIFVGFYKRKDVAGENFDSKRYPGTNSKIFFFLIFFIFSVILDANMT